MQNQPRNGLYTILDNQQVQSTRNPFFAQPWKPPDGIISDIIFKLMITASFGLMLTRMLTGFYRSKIKLWLQSVGHWFVREIPKSDYFPKGLTLYLKFTDVESASWCYFCSSTLPRFGWSYFDADDEILAHSAELERKVTNLAGTQQSHPDLERVKDVNPDP